MKKQIHVKEYTRKRHGRAKFGGKVSSHTKYIRATRRKVEGTKLIPLPAAHEEVDDNTGSLIAEWYDNEPFYQISYKPVLCFGRDKAGAILGAITGEKGFSGGTFYLYQSFETPDVDLSTQGAGDFKETGEVRYNRPIPAKFIESVYIPESIVEKVKKFYEEYRYDLALDTLKTFLGEKL